MIDGLIRFRSTLFDNSAETALGTERILNFERSPKPACNPMMNKDLRSDYETSFALEIVRSVARTSVPRTGTEHVHAKFRNLMVYKMI